MSSSISTLSLTLSTLPTEVLSSIALALPSCEFGRFLQTNRHIHDTLDTHWVWHQRFVNRFGQTVLKRKILGMELNTLTVSSSITKSSEDNINLIQTSKAQLIEWYRHYASLAIPAREMGIVHMNSMNWSMQEDMASEFGEVAKLNWVCWLDVSANFLGVPQGRYYVQWGYKVNEIEAVRDAFFRAAIVDRDEVPAWDNSHFDTIRFKANSARSFVKETNSPSRDRFQPGYMILQLPRVLEVKNSHATVFVQFKDHNNYTSKRDLAVDYVRLVNVDDSSKAFEPLPLDPKWID